MSNSELSCERSAREDSPPFAPVHFGKFEFDLRTGELRSHGTPIRLQPQPARILTLLVSRAGEVITREDLARQVWSSDTFVDFDKGLNFAIRRIRAALEDDAGQPQFLQTLHKRGYRFVAPLIQPVTTETLPTELSLTQPANIAAKAPTIQLPPPLPSSTQRVDNQRLRSTVVAALAITAVVALALSTAWQHLAAPKSTVAARGTPSVAVLPLHNLSRDPEQDYFSEGMTDELITDLAKAGNLHVSSHTSVDHYKETRQRLPEIARELSVDAVVEGTVMRSGNRVRITVQLIDARSDQHLWAETYQRDFRDVLSLQADVAHQIATQVGINLTAGEHERVARNQPPE